MLKLEKGMVFLQERSRYQTKRSQAEVCHTSDRFNRSFFHKVLVVCIGKYGILHEPLSGRIRIALRKEIMTHSGRAMPIDAAYPTQRAQRCVRWHIQSVFVAQEACRSIMKVVARLRSSTVEAS
jgi:hypothetical protein